MDAAAAGSIEAPHGAFHLRMAGVTDEDHVAPLARVALHLHVHLGHQRAGGIEHGEAARARLLLDRIGNPVRGEDHGAPVGHLGQLVDEDRAQPPQPLDHVSVVNDFVAHVDRRSEQLAAPARRCRWHGRRRRRSRADWRAVPASSCASVRVARLSRQASKSSTAAPTVMAESATLNAGKYALPACTWMKSTTRPRARRSIMLPSAPPTMSASPQASSPCALALQAAHPHEQRRAHPERQQHEQPALPSGGVGEEAESGAGVIGEDEVQHREHVHPLEQREVMHDPRLDRLVGHDHRRRERQPAPAAGRRRHCRWRSRRAGGASPACCRCRHRSYVFPDFAGPFDVADATRA